MNGWTGTFAGLVAEPARAKPERQPRAPKTEKPPRIEEKPIDWQRADPEALSHFDPATKRCTMNCGPHRADPRTWQERKFLCGDCWIVEP